MPHANNFPWVGGHFRAPRNMGKVYFTCLNLPRKITYQPSFRKLFWLLDSEIRSEFLIIEIYLSIPEVCIKTSPCVRYFAKY